MTWQLLLTLFLFLSTASYLYRRQLAVRYPEHNRLVNLIFYTVFLYPAGLIVALFDAPNLSIGWLNLALLLVFGGMFPLSVILAYRASKDMDAGLYNILVNIAPVISIIVAWSLLNEGLTNRQLLGAALIILSAFLVTTPLLQHRANSKPTGLIYALGAVTILGVAVVFERYMLTRMDLGAYLIYGWGSQVLWMGTLFLINRPKIKLPRGRRFMTPAFGFWLSNSLKAICFVAALKIANASVVSAFISFNTVLVVLAAYVFLKEQDWLWFKLGAAVIGITGMVILNT